VAFTWAGCLSRSPLRTGGGRPIAPILIAAISLIPIAPTPIAPSPIAPSPIPGDPDRGIDAVGIPG